VTIGSDSKAQTEPDSGKDMFMCSLSDLIKDSAGFNIQCPWEDRLCFAAVCHVEHTNVGLLQDKVTLYRFQTTRHTVGCPSM
jgi:hypothetical protein